MTGMFRFNVLLRNMAGYMKLAEVEAYNLTDAMHAAMAAHSTEEVVAVGPHISQGGGDRASLYAVEKVTGYQVRDGYKG